MDRTLVRYEAPTRVCESPGEKIPRKEGRISEDGVGYAVGGNACKLAKKEGEDDHHEDRLDDGPRDAENHLLVTDLDVAPDEEIQEFTMIPQLSQPDSTPSCEGRITTDWRVPAI